MAEHSHAAGGLLAAAMTAWVAAGDPCIDGMNAIDGSWVGHTTVLAVPVSHAAHGDVVTWTVSGTNQGSQFIGTCVSSLSGSPVNIAVLDLDPFESWLTTFSLVMQDNPLLVTHTVDGVLDCEGGPFPAGLSGCGNPVGVTIPADVDRNGAVAVPDLVCVLNLWATDNGLADVNDDGVVDVEDLVEVIIHWS